MIDRRLALALATVTLTACSSSDPGVSGGTSNGNGNGGSSGSTSGDGTTGTATEALQHCVDAINTYRAKVGATAYTRTSALETYAAAGAQSDGSTGSAHGHFGATEGGHGIAFAENELPGWARAHYTSMDDLIDQGMAAMWSEGPGGGHYDNMTSKDYTQAGCGVYTTSTNAVWVTIDFR